MSKHKIRYRLDLIIFFFYLFKKQFDCCGVNTYEDWLNSDWHQQNKNLSFPDSCCKTLKHCDNKQVEQIYAVGCYPVIVNAFNENLSTLGLGTFFIALFQVRDLKFYFLLN